METMTSRYGTARVISTRNNPDSPWSSRLYINETATTKAAIHRTTDGAMKWADKTLRAHIDNRVLA